MVEKSRQTSYTQQKIEQLDQLEQVGQVDQDSTLLKSAKKLVDAEITLQNVIKSFTSITLLGLQSRAALMDRRDNKYVLTTQEVIDLLERAKESFYLLEIDGLRQFHYLSTYYDSPDFQTHQDHNQGRRRRIKVRHRHYIDSGLHYFEVKLKGFRKLTQKVRTPLEPEKLPSAALSPRLEVFLKETLTEHYGEEFALDWLAKLRPSISVGYHRLTLVSKRDNKRITLDNGIYFLDESLPKEAQTPHYLNNKRWIIEVKSSLGRTAVDRWLARHRRRPVSACSKYGMGISLLKTPEENNRFRKTLRRHFKRP